VWTNVRMSLAYAPTVAPHGLFYESIAHPHHNQVSDGLTPIGEVRDSVATSAAARGAALWHALFSSPAWASSTARKPGARHASGPLRMLGARTNDNRAGTTSGRRFGAAGLVETPPTARFAAIYPPPVEALKLGQLPQLLCSYVVRVSEPRFGAPAPSSPVPKPETEPLDCRTDVRRSAARLESRKAQPRRPWASLHCRCDLRLNSDYHGSDITTQGSVVLRSGHPGVAVHVLGRQPGAK
jgi:hypothetical protein